MVQHVTLNCPESAGILATNKGNIQIWRYFSMIPKIFFSSPLPPKIQTNENKKTNKQKIKFHQYFCSERQESSDTSEPALNDSAFLVLALECLIQDEPGYCAVHVPADNTAYVLADLLQPFWPISVPRRC